MKIVNTLQHYVRFGYKTFVVDNYVLDEPSEFDEVLKGEYVYKNSKLFKALKNTVSSLKNLEDRNIFIEVQAYFDETPKTPETPKIKENDEKISKNVQSSETTEIEKAEDKKAEVDEVSQLEKVENLEKVETVIQPVNQNKTKKKR